MIKTSVYFKVRIINSLEIKGSDWAKVYVNFSLSQFFQNMNLCH